MRNRAVRPPRAAGVLAVAVALFLAWRLREPLLLLFAGLLFALLLQSATDWIHDHTRIPRGVALGLVVSAMVTAIAGSAWIAGPSVRSQVEQLRQQMPDAIARLKERLRDAGVAREALDQAATPERVLGSQSTVVQRITSAASATFGAAANALVIVLFGIFVAAQPELCLAGVVRLVRPDRRLRARETLVESGDAMRRWLVSKLIRMVFIGFATWLALRFLGVPVAGLLGIIAALLAFIPNFGPLIAAVPAVLLALLQGLDTALWVAAVYMAVQFIEGNVLDPVLTKTIVAVPPALTFAVQVTLAVLAGPIGLAVATPLTAGALVIVRRLYVEDVVERRGPHEPR